MYHSISDKKESGHPYYWLNTSPKRFYEHMKFLKDNGYKVISLSEAVNTISNTPVLNKPCELNKLKQLNQPKYVVLTFDDGYRDFYTTAWPILSQFGFPVTVFLPTGFIGGSFKKKECLSWSDVRELHRRNVSFGSHTVNHPQLHGLSWKDIELELGNSKKAIEDQLGAYVVDFSYPYAYPDADKAFCKRLASTLWECGYTHCVTTRLGCSAHGDDVLSLRRMPVNDSDDLFLFKAKLEGHYDWLCIGQRFIKNRQQYKKYFR